MVALTVTATVTDSLGNTGSATASCTIGDTFTLGETKPTAPFVGLNVNNPTLTVHNGDFLMNPAWLAANPLGILANRHIKGHLVFTANAACVVTDCKVEGRTFPTAGSPPYGAIVYARSTSTASTSVLNVYNCEIFPIQPDVNIVCCNGERLGNVRRSNIYWGSDGLNYWGRAPEAHGNWIHNLTFWDDDDKHANDGSHPYWSHNDGIQSNGGHSGDVFGNNIDMHMDPVHGTPQTLINGGFPDLCWGSAVMLSGSQGYFTDMEVQKNWFSGGQAPVAMPLQSGGDFEDGGCDWEVSENRFYGLPDPYGTNQRQFIRWGWGKGPLPASVFGNVFTNDTTIPVDHRGDALPTAVLVGSANNSGQYIVKLNID